MNNNIHPLTDIFDAGLTTNYETPARKDYGIHIDTVEKGTFLGFEDINDPVYENTHEEEISPVQ